MSNKIKKSLYVFLLLLCSCGQKSKSQRPPQQELRLNMHIEPISLDPRKPNDATNATFLKMCFDGLTRIGLDGKPQLALAKEMTLSSDQRVYTVTLREALWSDGVSITAQDFEESWKTRLDPSFPCESAAELFVLKNARAAKSKKCPLSAIGVTAIDARTLRIELEHPLPCFPHLLSSFCFAPVPRHIVSSHSDWADKDSKHYVCNGPFLLKEWRSSNFLLLEKNERYWDKEHVRLKRIHLLLIEDANTELQLFEKGKLDWAGSPMSSLPSDALSTLRNVQTYPMAGTYYYIFNTKHPLLQNVKLRRALALAIDRRALIEYVAQSKSLATSFIPSALCPQRRSYFSDNDTVNAKRYFKEALEELHLALSSLPTLTLSYNTLQTHHLIAQAIQEQWRDILGIKVRLENKEWKVYLDEKRQHKFQIARMGSVAASYDPLAYLDSFRTLCEDNVCEWTSPAFTALLEKAETTPDAAVRMDVIMQAEKILMDEMPVIPLYFYAGNYLKKPYVKDVFLSDLGEMDCKWAYIEE